MSDDPRRAGRELRSADTDSLLGRRHADDEELLEQIGLGRREERPRRARRRTQRSRLVRTITLVLASLLVLGGGLWTYHLVSPLFSGLSSEDAGHSDYPGPGENDVVITIPQGASGREIGEILQAQDVVKSASTFASLAELDERGQKLQPGSYRVKTKMSSDQALGALVDPGRRAGKKLTIPEGKWKSEIFAELSKTTGIPVKEFEKVTPEEVDLPAAANGEFEGWLFPATYEITPNLKAKDYVKAMVDQAKFQISQLGIQPGEYQRTVIKASIIQAEGRNVDDFGKVGRVIENRLNQGMKLGMDSTIHYVQKRRGNIHTSSKDQQVKSAYNTYQNTGLPPAPIGNPGSDALSAAANPPEGDELFFVTTDPCTGETVFATSYDDHLKNQQAYDQWAKEHPDGKC